MLKTKLTLISLACFAASSNAIAQTTNNNSDTTRIVITAKGQQTEADLATVSHIITQDDIERSQANDVNELLQATSGISITRSGGRGAQSSTFLRGTTATQTVVLVDGIRIGSATLGSTELGHIPVEAIERIEVLKGPLSGIYGADAVGGVIQIFTKKGTEKASFVSLEAGSFGHKSIAAGASQNGFNITFSAQDNEGIDATANEADGNDDKDSFNETSLSVSGNFKIDEKSDLQINALYSENDIVFDNLFGADTGHETANEIGSLSVQYQRSFNHFGFSSYAGYSINQSDTPVFAVFGSSQFDTSRLTAGSQLDFNLGSNSKLIVGADYRDDSVDSNANFAETDRDNTGLFAQYQTKVGKTGYIANLRVDNDSEFGTETNGSLGVNYRLSDTTRLTASYGTAFRAPTFNELFFPFSGNPDIQPEESKTLELGLRGGANGHQWRISAYDTSVENLIEYPAPNYLATNVSEASLQGIELEYGANLGGWYINSSLDLLNAENEATGDDLIRRPDTSLKFSADRSFGNFDFGADLIAERGRIDSFADLDDYERVDVRGTYNVSPRFKLAAKVTNLFDEDYELVSGFNTEGIGFKLTGKYNF